MKKCQKISLVLLRLSLGWLMFYAGITKILNPDWTAGGFLSNLGGPFASFFQQMAGSNIVDFLNMWGLTLLGISLILGAFVRLSSFLGIILMALYWMAAYPAPHSMIVDDHFIYIVALLVLIAFNAGKYFGLAQILKKILPFKLCKKIIG